MMFLEKLCDEIADAHETLEELMALLQIAEPGESTAPHQHRLAVGIDLGTTNSLVATVRNGVPVVPQRRERSRAAAVRGALPRRRHDRGGARGAGAQADDPRNTIVSVKRFMGRGLADVAHVESMPYIFEDAPGMLRLRTAQGVKSPVEVSADILRVLRERAEASLGGPLTGAVITVPAYFDDAQRQATKDAARLAGLNVLRLLNEPTAAAIAYGLDNASEGIYAVYDLGGGTFDISILKLSKGVFEVLATSGDAVLGGDDFDHRVYCWMLERRASQPPASKTCARMYMEARRAKEALSSADEVHIGLKLPSGDEIDVSLTRDAFVDITRTLVDKTLVPTRKALRDAGLEPSDVKGVVMVGGATRMPQVQQAVGRFLRPGAADQSRSGQGGGDRRRHPGQCAGGQSRGRRRLAAARRHSAVARAGNDGRSGREGDSAQFHDPIRARPGIHHLQGRPDGHGHPCRAGRARARVRLPFAGPLRTARHSTDGGWCGAHPRDLPGRCRWFAIGNSPRANDRCRIEHYRQARPMGCPTTRSPAC
jgi:actin-like ATPase involved in cell morphogenesis